MNPIDDLTPRWWNATLNRPEIQNENKSLLVLTNHVPFLNITLDHGKYLPSPQVCSNITAIGNKSGGTTIGDNAIDTTFSDDKIIAKQVIITDTLNKIKCKITITFVFYEPTWINNVKKSKCTKHLHKHTL